MALVPLHSMMHLSLPNLNQVTRITLPMEAVVCLSVHLNSPFPGRGIRSVAYCAFGYYRQLVVFTKRLRVCICLSTISVNGYAMCAATGCSLDSVVGQTWWRAVLIVGARDA